jgi:hypothetical protein
MTETNTRIKNANMVMESIATWYKTHEYGPSYRDLVDLTGLSLGTVYNVCQELRESQEIDFLDNVARTIKLKG